MSETIAVYQAGKPKQLTEKEREVLQKLAEGMTQKQIAASMGVCIETIHSRIWRARRRLGGITVIQTILLAYDTGEIAPKKYLPLEEEISYF